MKAVRMLAIAVMTAALVLATGCSQGDASKSKEETASQAGSSDQVAEVIKSDVMSEYIDLTGEVSAVMKEAADNPTANKDELKDLSERASRISRDLDGMKADYPEAADLLDNASSAANASSHVVDTIYETAVAIEAGDTDTVNSAAEDLKKYTQLFTLYANSATDIMAEHV